MTYGGAVDPRKTSVVSLLGWYQDEDNLVELQMKAQTGKWVLEQRINGKVVAKKKARMVIAQNTSYDVRLVYDGVEFRLYVDQQLAIRMQSVGTPQGTVGFQTRNASARFDLIQVY